MMTSKSMIQIGLVTVTALSILNGCSTLKSGESVAELSQTKPNVINPRINPDNNIELNRDMQPQERVEIVTEVKDFGSEVTNVTMRLQEVPFEITLAPVGGTTWRAQINPALIQRLAVGNQTTNYTAKIYAKNAKGTVVVSDQTVKFSVVAPDLSRHVG